MKRTVRIICTLFLALLLASAVSITADAASRYDAALAKWSRFMERRDDMGGRFLIRATLYTAEYIETLLESEAEKNLWTKSELEDYKYNFLKGLNLEDSIAIHLEMEELGATAHMAPFNEMVYLWIGNKKYEPSNYDQRFNLPLQGKRDGMVFFPRYDEKTGQPLLKKDTSLRFVMNSAASPVLGNTDVRFIWDVKAESLTDTLSGSGADRLEVDRLLRRMERLAAEKEDLESQLGAKDREIEEVNKRIEELQGRN